MPDKDSKNKIFKTIIGSVILLALLGFIAFRLVSLFRKNTTDQYSTILYNYYQALNKAATNDLSHLISDEFHTEIPYSMWTGNNPNLYVFDIKILNETNQHVASHKVVYTVINNRHHTAFLNEAYFIQKGDQLYITYIDNLYKTFEVRK